LACRRWRPQPEAIVVLHHHNPSAAAPVRVVILGSGGFIGNAIWRQLCANGRTVIGLPRDALDLSADGAADRLAPLLHADDALVIAAAKAPCKTPAMMLENVRMMAAVCEALATQPVAHLVYISSDAVYADGPLPLAESSPAAPASLHGAMHLAREHMLRSVAGAVPFAILRPTLVYGASDPHNGYGPNKFRRQANSGKHIVLVGDGEEERDHVDVDDVAQIVNRVLDHRSSGVLNIATGTVATFRTVAEKVAALAPRSVPISSSPRNGPMPHNGYRPFDPAATLLAFPGFRYTAIDAGFARAQQQEFG
jgi:nucleoside-diphosphate-sugar epimerase